MCANNEGSGETARMRKLAWASAGRLCDKYHNLMNWLKYRLYFRNMLRACSMEKNTCKYDIRITEYIALDVTYFGSFITKKNQVSETWKYGRIAL